MAQEDILRTINDRWRIVHERYGQRDRRFKELFDAYDGKIWAGKKKEHEQRVAVRIVADMVDMDTAILAARPPIITVPPSRVSGVADAEASLLENALLGCWDMMDFWLTAVDMIRFASLTGWGVLRGPIFAPSRDFPLVATAPDPRLCYPFFSGAKDVQYNFYSQWRTAGDVRGDIPRAARDVRGKWDKSVLPDNDDALLCWTEYWGWHDTDLLHGVFINEVDQEGVQGEPPSVLPKQADIGGLTWDSYVGKALKKPTKMNDSTGKYTKVPYHYIFPRPDPRAEPGYEGQSFVERLDGTQKALSRLATILATDAINRGTPPMWGDGPIQFPHDESGTPFIDTEAGGFTQVAPGTHLDVLPGVMDHNLVKQLYDLLEDSSGRSGLPRSMFGQYEPAESGLALSVRNAPVQMKEALAQKRIEAGLRQFNQDIFRLLKRIPEDTIIRGLDKRGALIDLKLSEIPLSDYVYNHVQLSSSLPKDIPALIASMVQVCQVKGISIRTLMEYVQNMVDLPNKDPEYEFERLAEEEIMLAKQNIDTMAAAQAYQTLVQSGMLGQVPIGGAQGGSPLGAPQVGPGGIPSQMMPPQAEGMGAGLRQGMGMEGQAPPQGLIPGPVSGAQGAMP